VADTDPIGTETFGQVLIWNNYSILDPESMLNRIILSLKLFLESIYVEKVTICPHGNIHLSKKLSKTVLQFGA